MGRCARRSPIRCGSPTPRPAGAFATRARLWKHFLKQQFLEPKVEEYIARRGDSEEVRVRMLRLSTEDLTDDEYNEFLMEVQSFGVNECGVIFDEEI
jgi:hypothetical protein